MNSGYVPGRRTHRISGHRDYRGIPELGYAVYRLFAGRPMIMYEQGEIDLGASLSYGQSLAAYLIDTHGWEMMRELLAAFQEGSTYDDALLRVYGINMDILDQEWRQHVGVK